MYIETSSPRRPGDVARLVSQTFSPSGNGRCISFYYNMYGQTVDTLRVLVQVQGKSISIFHGHVVWIEKSVTRVTDLHREACRVLPNSDYK